jgi:hypothetical protein
MALFPRQPRFGGIPPLFPAPRPRPRRKPPRRPRTPRRPTPRTERATREEVLAQFPGRTQPFSAPGLGKNVTVGGVPVGRFGTAIDTGTLRRGPGESVAQAIARSVQESEASGTLGKTRRFLGGVAATRADEARRRIAGARTQIRRMRR